MYASHEPGLGPAGAAPGRAWPRLGEKTCKVYVATTLKLVGAIPTYLFINLNLGYTLPMPGSWILAPGFRIQDPGPRIHIAVGSWDLLRNLAVSQHRAPKLANNVKESVEYYEIT